ncbi:MAG TPA: NAD(P)-dependent oxidoreductase [Candidatus Dormibacteraeota bacterium]|nr:NAD(P)-dependent oxidoreductase [Candidatus Dormibacteraeota bacterium]
MGENRRMKVAILGTGKMGAAIARRLAAEKVSVVLWNRTRAKADAVGAGKVAADPGSAAAEADIILSVLTGPDAVREAYEGRSGALEAAGADKVFVDMTTGGPASAEWLDAQVRERGGHFLEAPVMGGPAAIESGKLLILAGGAASTLDTARQVLSKLGDIRHIGEVGSANKLKLIGNSMLAGTSALAAELQAAGEEIGLSQSDIFWVLQRFAPALEQRKAGYLEQRYQPVAFALKDIVKDIDLALEIYGHAGAETPITSLDRQLYADELAEHAEDDMSAINARFRKPGTQSKA